MAKSSLGNLAFILALVGGILMVVLRLLGLLGFTMASMMSFGMPRLFPGYEILGLILGIVAIIISKRAIRTLVGHRSDRDRNYCTAGNRGPPRPSRRHSRPDLQVRLDHPRSAWVSSTVELIPLTHRLTLVTAMSSSQYVHQCTRTDGSRVQTLAANQ